MKNWFSNFLKDTTPQGRNAFRAAIIVVAAALAAAPIYIYLAKQSGAWQVYAVTAGVLTVTLVGLISAALARRNRVELAIGLLLTSTSLIISLHVALISGLGLVLSITLFLLVAAIVGQTLSGQFAARTLILGTIFAALTLLMEVFVPWHRLSFPLLQSAIPFVAAAVIVALGFFVVSQYRNYSLRTKLLIGFILVAVVPLSILFFLDQRAFRQNLSEQANATLQSQALQAAVDVDRFIEEGLTDVRTFAALHIFEEYLNLPVSERPGSETETVLYKDLRSIAGEDEHYITSVGLIDLKGQNIADTDPNALGVDRSTRLYFSEPVRTNEPYVSPLEIAQSTGRLSLYFSAPVRDLEGNIIGVLRIRYDAEIIQKIVEEAAGTQGAFVTLFDENHIRLAHSTNPELILKLVVPPSAKLLASLQAEHRLPENTTAEQVSTDLPDLEKGLNSFDTQPLFTSHFAGSGEELDNAAVVHLAQQPWLVTAAQPQSVYLAPVNNQVRTAAVAIIVILSLVAVSAVIVSQSFSRPLIRLTHVAQQISAGDLSAQAEIASKDEIGLLAGAFNTMTSQLRELIGSLEQRVADRTKALAASTEVSRRLSTILDQRQLVNEVVVQVRSAFNYYHAHIYLFDDDRQELIMVGGTGEAGQTMLASGHKISKDKGLVGRAAETNSVLLVPDVSKNPDWLPNPLLPETKSEIAVPLSIGNQLLGVLDVQHNVADGLTQEDADLLQSIASQVAVALQNIRQYENTQKIAADMGVVANVGIAASTVTDATLLLQEVVDLSKKAFNLYHAHIYLLNETGDSLELISGAGEVGRQMVFEKRSIPLDSEQSLVARAARDRSGVVVNDVTTAPDFLPNPLLPDTRSEMAVPMIVAGKVIGVLDVQSETANRFTAVDVSIQTTLASQVAVALQNARSFEQSQRQAERESAVNLITQKIQSATSIEAALQITARELGHALGMKPTLVSLEPEALEPGRKGDGIGVSQN